MSGRRRPFGRVLRLGGLAKDLDEELAFHFAETVRELEASGLTGAAAREEAGRRFGDERSYRRELERIDRSVAARRRRVDRLEVFGQTLKYAWRSLASSPGLALGIVLAFALGIGANATMFGIVERLLMRAPEHIVAPERVQRLFVEQYLDFMGERVLTSTVSYPDYAQLRQAGGFGELAAYTSRTVVVGRGVEAEETAAVWASANFFPLLGVRPALGRFYDEREDRIGGESVVVLSHAYWQRAFGGAPDVLGRTLDFGYGPWTVVGVAPAGFTGVDLRAVDVFLPLHRVAELVQGTEWSEPSGKSWQWFAMVGRMAEGVTAERAAAEATTLHQAFRREDIERGEWGGDPRIVLGSVIAAHRPQTGSVTGGTSGAERATEPVVAKLLFGVAAVVLLIACLNVANLLLARLLRQRREVAVRLALGISRRRLIGQILLEGLLLGLLGGAAALLVAHWGGALVRRLLLPDVAWDQLGTTSAVVGFVAVLALLAGLLSAVLPALQATRGQLAPALRQAGAGGVTRGTARLRLVLALAQTALSVVLLVGAGLFVRSLDRVQHTDLGFEVDGLLYAAPRAQRDAFDDGERIRLFERGAERIARLPGVRHVGATTTLPFYSHTARRFSAEGVDSVPTPKTGGPYLHAVSPDYFPAMGLEIRRGRGFSASDGRGAPPVALLGETMARGLWPGEDPVGKCIRVGGATREDNASSRCIQVVGTVEDARRQSVRSEETFQYYLPLAQRAADSVPSLLVVRVAEETPAVMSAIRRELVALDGRIRWAEVEPMQERIAPQLRSWQLGATLFSLFGALALVVAALGLYSVLAFDVAQRTRELGVRAALGASRPELVQLVVRRALLVTAVGVALGSVVALLLVGRVEPLLFEIPPRDPVTFVAVFLALHAVALVASSLPGWRASAVEPNRALREE